MVSSPLLAATGTAQNAKVRPAKQWLAERQADLLAVPYYHIVFTMPAAIADIHPIRCARQVPAALASLRSTPRPWSFRWRSAISRAASAVPFPAASC